LNASNIITKLKNREPSILGQENFLKYAVLLPLIEVNGDTHILFEVRSMNLQTQPGDICFPGGRVEKTDHNPRHTAIRETSEELGIYEEDISDVIPIDYMVSGFGKMIYPFLGRINNPQEIQPNKNEVKETFTVPLTYFLNTKPKTYKVYFEVVPEDDFPYDLIAGGKNYDWRTRHTKQIFYNYEGRVIWGLTSKILTHFLTLVTETE